MLTDVELDDLGNNFKVSLSVEQAGFAEMKSYVREALLKRLVEVTEKLSAIGVEIQNSVNNDKA